jgi:hypothetical protein
MKAMNPLQEIERMPPTSKRTRRYWPLLILGCIALLLVILNVIVARPASKGKRIELQTLKDLSELATVEYDVKKIIRYKDESWLMGRRAILIETSAILKAGIDLSELTSQDIKQEGDAITIYLPRPKLISLNMKPRDMKEIYNEAGIFRQNFSAAEKEIFLTQGQKDIMSKLDEIGIIGKAAVYSKLLLETWLKILGFREITILFKDPAKKSPSAPA